ncbi:MAG TPA: SIMPL domain-containing protein [Dehalococcoidia bacterium]|nr:SIMPL domain-containing protein [Dehalococcoidia bacterium]
MKRTWLILAGLAVLLVAVAVGCTTKEGTNGGNSNPVANLSIPGIAQQSGIWVTGEGKVKSIPDTAVLVLGIEAQATTVSDAQQQAQKSMDAIVKALKSNGVADKDIQTQRFSITPVVRYNDKENRQEIIGYQVSNIVTAKIRRVNDTGPVIDAVAQAGGDQTRIDSISFTLDDPSALQEQAQTLALKDAKARAKAVADTLGVRLGKLTYAQVNASAPPPTPIFFAKGAFEAAPTPTTPINPGEITIQASVTTAWGIE